MAVCARPAAEPRQVLAELQKGRIDRSLAASLAPLGAEQEITQGAQSLRGGITGRRLRVVLPKRTLHLTTFAMPDGKLELFRVGSESPTVALTYD